MKCNRCNVFICDLSVRKVIRTFVISYLSFNIVLLFHSVLHIYIAFDT